MAGSKPKDVEAAVAVMLLAIHEFLHELEFQL